MAAITVKVDALTELTLNDKFPILLEKRINQIQKARHEASLKGKLKRHPVDYLYEHSMFNADAMAAEFRRIRAKNSTLPSTVRKLIESIVELAIYDLLSSQKVSEQEKQEVKEPVPTPKPKTRKKAVKTVLKNE